MFLIECSEIPLYPLHDIQAQKYDCAFAISLRGPDGLSVTVSSGNTTSGTSNKNKRKPITLDQKFAWGSVTKMITGVSIIRLANEGEYIIIQEMHTYTQPSHCRNLCRSIVPRR